MDLAAAGAGVLVCAVEGVADVLVAVGALGRLNPEAAGPFVLAFGAATEERTLLTLRAAPFVTVAPGLAGVFDITEERTRGAATTDERGDTVDGGGWEGAGLSSISETAVGLMNIPQPGAHVKYLSPWTEPSFFPVASSSSTPIQSPGAKLAAPTKRITALRPSGSEIT